MRKNKSKVRFVESSFGQKVRSAFPVAQYRIASPYQYGAIVPCNFEESPYVAARVFSPLVIYVDIVHFLLKSIASVIKYFESDFLGK
jgi:hypothetical protein